LFAFRRNLQLAKASAKPLKNGDIPQIRQDVRYEFDMA